MYSVVLMAALTAGTATPDCHHRCGGCCGCYGGWGGCYGGCWGCYGGCYGGFGGCYGCGGGCWGGWGGCYGCWGGYSSWGCMGCMGCVGGVGGVGGLGYDGMSFPGGVAPGGAGIYGGTAPGGAAPGTGTGSGEQLGNPKENKGKGSDKEVRLSPNRARLVVEVPQGAKLFIDDMPMKTGAGVRSFNTPELEPGQAYYYMVRVETVRDGKTVAETRRVIVRAGQVARAEFKDLGGEAIRTVRAK